MNRTFFLILAAAIMLASVAGAIVCYEKKYKRGSLFTVKNCLFAGVAAAAFLLYLPIYLHSFEGTNQGILEAIFSSFYGVIGLFIADGDFGFVLDIIEDLSGWLYFGYSHLYILLMVAAPVLTFGFILSFVRSFTSHAEFYFRRGGNSYVFSQLSEKSLALAKSIRSNHGKKAKIVFTDIDNSSNDLYEKARELDAICFVKDILSLDFSHHRKTRFAVKRTPIEGREGEYTVTEELLGRESYVNLFLISDDESENLRQAIEIVGSSRYNRNFNVYVFSTQLESELLLSHVYNNRPAEPAQKGFLGRIGDSLGKLWWKLGCKLSGKELYRYDGSSRPRVRRINRVSSLVFRTVYDEGYRAIFESALPADKQGIRAINALVLGMGSYGKEMAKALSWACQMDGYRLELHGADSAHNAAEEFSYLCPELMDGRHNGVFVDGDASCKIEIHSGIDAGSRQLEELVRSLPPITYVLVALGDDEQNIATAVNLRGLFARLGRKPIIQAIVYNPEKKQALSDLTNFRNQPYDIEYIGDLESSYSEKTVMHSDVEKVALERHLKWGSEADFWRYDYNYKSSMASAIHKKLRSLCGIAGAEKAPCDRTEEELWNIRRLEHCRWNAYMRSEGYSYSGSIDKSSRNDMAKLHHCLVPFDELPLEEKIKDDD